MSYNTCPRLLIAGTNSGSGKTTIVNAILRAIQKQNIPLCGFKCGPDYIDPMFHKAALGIPSYNLDLFFSSEQECKNLLAKHTPNNGIGIIEGVMGFYDGISGTTDVASSAHLARTTDTPTVLVVRPKGQSLSVGATLYGFKNFAPNTLKGVIFNGVSSSMYQLYKKIAQEVGLKSYGYLPEIKQTEIPSRHLGLVTADELNKLQQQLDILACEAQKSIDITGLIELSKTAPALFFNENQSYITKNKSVRIGVAKDKAFCFYYQDNLDLLEENGAELVPFSPLNDKYLPENMSGLYIGGGYPELYADELSNNKSMLYSINCAINNKMPTIAECGGFMYLHSSIVALDGVSYPMADVIKTTAHMTNKLQNFGYITMTAQKDCLTSKKGETMNAHEFHYCKSDNSGNDFYAKKPNGKSWNCVYANDTLYAGYPHLYFRASKHIISRFLNSCAKFGGNL